MRSTSEDADSRAPALTYIVPDMTCGHCEATVTDAVAAVPGVDAVGVDLHTKRVVVQGTDVADDAVRAAVAIAGYEAFRS